MKTLAVLPVLFAAALIICLPRILPPDPVTIARAAVETSVRSAQSPGQESEISPSEVARHNCDFTAVIAMDGFAVANIVNGPDPFDDPDDFFYDFIIDRSQFNLNGYGIIHSDGDAITYEPDLYYSEFPYQNNPAPLDAAHAAIMDPANGAIMVMAHDRTGTGGFGNHPFFFEWNDEPFVFMHNGSITQTIKEALHDELYDYTGSYPGEWFVQHPSNWVAPQNTSHFELFIDSEILFHWIMKNVIDNDGNVLAGIYAALTARIDNGAINLRQEFDDNWASNKINWVLGDAEALYVFRNTDPTSLQLEYKVFDAEGFVAVKTQNDLVDPLGDCQIDQDTLVYIPRNASPAEIRIFQDYGWKIFVDAANVAGPWEGTEQNPFRYIQSGIDAADNGNLILVRAGHYDENLDFMGKAITLRYDGPPGQIVVDGNQMGSVVTFDSGEGLYSVLDGLVVTAGFADLGGGIYCGKYCSPSIINNTITSNGAGTFYHRGGGIYCSAFASPTIANNEIIGNQATQYGGAICCWKGSRARIENNLMSWNSATADTVSRGGAVYCYECSPTLINNTIYDNSADLGIGGGIYCYFSSPAIIQSIFWQNSGGEIEGFGGNPQVTYCDVEGGYAGTGNFDANPAFFDPTMADFHLIQVPCQTMFLSPCVDAGNPARPLLEGSTRTDAVQDTSIVDIGYHYPTEHPAITLEVTPDPLLAGNPATFTVTHGEPNESTFLAYSVRGPGATYVPQLDVMLGLTGPTQAGGVVQSDLLGQASWTLPIPPNTAGLDIWLQAVQDQQATNVVASWVY